jgi:hypothetical protein
LKNCFTCWWTFRQRNVRPQRIASRQTLRRRSAHFRWRRHPTERTTTTLPTKRGTGHICFVERGLAHVLVLQKTKLKEARQLLEASRAEYLQMYGPKNNVCVQCIDAAIADLNKITAQ